MKETLVKIRDAFETLVNIAVFMAGVILFGVIASNWDNIWENNLTPDSSSAYRAGVLAGKRDGFRVRCANGEAVYDPTRSADEWSDGYYDGFTEMAKKCD